MQTDRQRSCNLKMERKQVKEKKKKNSKEENANKIQESRVLQEKKDSLSEDGKGTRKVSQANRE